MRVINYFIVFLLFTGIASAQNFNDYSSLEIQSNFSSKLSLEYKESNYKIDYVTANLNFFPRNNEFQSSTYELTSNPKASTSTEENIITYKWNNPSKSELKYELNSKIKTQINFKKIKNKIKFPLNYNDELEDYLKESKTVTSNDPEIKKKAAELAEGEDDLFVVVHKIGAWTKENINYSLDTLTIEASQDSSWVFQNKRGVCDELTALFVAMLRSINIPARFVTGQAYTNVINGFGNHAWAEVYFPGYGWIPFDPTYGQLGYVDSTHIKMKDSIDIKEASIDYAWRSYGVDLSSGKLNVNSSIISKGELYKESVKLEGKLLEEKVGPGSYVPFEIDIENLNDYYLPLSLDLVKAPKEIENLEQNILLKPKELKKIFFIIEIPNEADNGFTYTSTAEVKDRFNNYVSESIKFGNEYNIYTLQEANEKISELSKENDKIYSGNVEIKCIKDKLFYYDDENINVGCSIKNIGNVNLEDLNLCYLNECGKINLIIGENKAFDISLEPKDVEKEISIKVENEYVSRNLFFDLNILKSPNLVISNLNYPKNMNYNDVSKITFTLSSDSEIKNLKINLGERETIKLNAFKGENDFNINFDGREFYNKNSDLILNYEDQNGKTYSLNQGINVEVDNAPFYIKYFGVIIIILVVIISMILRRRLRH
ncbi:MAG: transglutaminase-like domain-containing protein [Nanoarchaeota archaeon]